MQKRSKINEKDKEGVSNNERRKVINKHRPIHRERKKGKERKQRL